MEEASLWVNLSRCETGGPECSTVFSHPWRPAPCLAHSSQGCRLVPKPKYLLRTLTTAWESRLTTPEQRSTDQTSNQSWLSKYLNILLLSWKKLCHSLSCIWQWLVAHYDIHGDLDSYKHCFGDLLQSVKIILMYCGGITVLDLNAGHLHRSICSGCLPSCLVCWIQVIDWFTKAVHYNPIIQIHWLVLLTHFPQNNKSSEHFYKTFVKKFSIWFVITVIKSKCMPQSTANTSMEIQPTWSLKLYSYFLRV